MALVKEAVDFITRDSEIEDLTKNYRKKEQQCMANQIQWEISSLLSETSMSYICTTILHWCDIQVQGRLLHYEGVILAIN